MSKRLDEVEGQWGKNGWHGDAPSLLILRAERKLEQLKKVFLEQRYEEVLAFSADLGNYAMMIFDNVKGASQS